LYINFIVFLGKWFLDIQLHTHSEHFGGAADQLSSKALFSSGSTTMSEPLQEGDIHSSVNDLDDISGAYDCLGDPVSELWWIDNEEITTLSTTGGDQDMITGSQDENEVPIVLDDLEDSPNKKFFQLPNALEDLRKALLGDYKLPLVPPKRSQQTQQLTESETYTLMHYIAWSTTNGTVDAYEHHAKVLQMASKTEILSLYQAKKLAHDLTGFIPHMVDMCPRSCIAYTGAYESLEKCPYSRGKDLCNEPRYHKPTTSGGCLAPRAQVQILPVMATIRAMFANADTAKLLRHRDSCLQSALHLVGSAATRKYSYYGDSQIHVMQHDALGLFQDPRDIAFALSTDGAQLTMKKQSNTWLLILVILNLPGSIRYHTDNVIINFATPGPNSPGDIESFIWPLFQEMAMASEGIWMWDAIDSSIFVHKSCISMALGDMLGSAKLNGMTGHTGLFGDRFSMVQGAKSSCIRGAKSQYYPMNPPENTKYNPSRPSHYDLSKLPMRSQDIYWSTIKRLANATTKKEHSEIAKSTGISRLPLCAASVAFTHPTFFPLDPFHLFYENCVAFIWDIWTSFSKSDEIVYLSPEKARTLGSFVPLAMKTLPSAFCGPIRDPYLKWQSQYKIYEWMALLHWYIIPIGIEIQMDSTVLKNFSRFLEAIEFAMTISPRSDAEIQNLHKIISLFLVEYEQLYIGNDPERILRARLCIFQLIHVPHHIQWNGSIRVGSQATVERSIGEMGHKIRSKKAPFANLTNLIYQKELVKILLLHYPSLNPKNADRRPKSSGQPLSKFMQKHPLGKHTREIMQAELEAVSQWLNFNILENGVSLKRWGKFKLLNGNVLGSCLSQEKAQSARRNEWFEVRIFSPVMYNFNLLILKVFI